MYHVHMYLRVKRIDNRLIPDVLAVLAFSVLLLDTIASVFSSVFIPYLYLQEFYAYRTVLNI